MPTPSSRRIGMTLLLTGIAVFVGSRYWLATRKLIPLDMPISLAVGHIKTQDFNINFDSGYYVEIEVEKTRSLDNLECLMWGCYETPSILNVTWHLSRNGEVESSGSSEETNGASGTLDVVGRDVGYFGS